MVEDIIEFSAELQLHFVPGQGKVLEHGYVVKEKSRLAKWVPESYQRTTRVDANFFFIYSPRLTSTTPIPMRPAKCIHDTYIHDATSRRGSCFLVAGDRPRQLQSLIEVVLSK
jgi:hypothetical protein